MISKNTLYDRDDTMNKVEELALQVGMTVLKNNMGFRCGNEQIAESRVRDSISVCRRYSRNEREN